MTVELRHLRAFLAIAAEGNVTRAAARTHVSQPALSRTLRQLEDHLGARLVDRSTHHLELTAAGRLFQVRATAALAGIDALLDPAQLGAWPLRLGHAWSAMGVHTTTLLRRWKAAHPDIPLELLRIDDRTAGLARGSVHAALLRGESGFPGLRKELLGAEDRLAAVPADGPLGDRSELALADLVPYPVALNPVSGTTTLSLWPASARPETTVTTGNTDDWLTTVAAGKAVGVTSTATAALHPYPGVTYVPLVDAPPVRFFLAWTEPLAHPAIPDLVILAKAVIQTAARD
jgi:DNA-binding transcriptional LysR family regulator